MSFIADKTEYKGHLIEIIADDNPESPREWDNMGTMECFHKRYRLGDKGEHRSEEFGGWEAFEEHLEKEHGAAITLPLYLYDHSGITMNTTGFSCPWDSGQVGFIWVSREKLLKEYSAKRLTKALLKKAREVLDGEVQTYDQYLRGDIYGYRVFGPEPEACDKCGAIEDREELESCWGFYGADYCLTEAKRLVDAMVRDAAKTKAS